MTKQCRKCLRELCLENFTTQKKRKDGRHSYCKFCMRETMKAIYIKDSSLIKQRNTLLKAKLASLVEDFRSINPCKICAEGDTSCLDFHHINPADKDRTISELIQMKNEKRLMAEIKKCVVLCANCHRKLHAGKIDLNKLR